jgi:hypothetical protein
VIGLQDDVADLQPSLCRRTAVSAPGGDLAEADDHHAVHEHLHAERRTAGDKHDGIRRLQMHRFDREYP